MTDTISNEPTTTEITVTKTWQGAEGTPLEEDLPDSVEVTLYQQTDEGEPVQYGDPLRLPLSNRTYTWEQLPKEVDGQAVTYTVVETPITAGKPAMTMEREPPVSRRDHQNYQHKTVHLHAAGDRRRRTYPRCNRRGALSRGGRRCILEPAAQTPERGKGP